MSAFNVSASLKQRNAVAGAVKGKGREKEKTGKRADCV